MPVVIGWKTIDGVMPTASSMGLTSSIKMATISAINSTLFPTVKVQYVCLHVIVSRQRAKKKKKKKSHANN